MDELEVCWKSLHQTAVHTDICRCAPGEDHGHLLCGGLDCLNAMVATDCECQDGGNYPRQSRTHG